MSFNLLAAKVLHANIVSLPPAAAAAAGLHAPLGNTPESTYKIGVKLTGILNKIYMRNAAPLQYVLIGNTLHQMMYQLNQ